MADGGVFEVDHWDGAARGGRLAIPDRGTVETPALLPVVNPNRPTVPGAELASLGAQIAITNAYVLYDDPDLREAARERGVHDLIGFDGPVMTDSGAFQLAEYGDIDASNEEILAYQREIDVDVATPVDLPTPPDADHETAAADLETTEERVAAAVAGGNRHGATDTGAGDTTGNAATDDRRGTEAGRVADRAAGEAAAAAGGPLLAAPVQGGTHPDLRTRAAEAVAGRGADIYPVGGVVPLLRDYRFDDVVAVTRAAKRGLPLDAPVHLFGAGHPMAFALAAACGCDLFDSAAYALYAREDRYLTVRGTLELDESDELPCPCPVCTERTPASLRDRPDDERERLLARHNLHVSFAECRRVRDAIRSGDLFELLEQRARAHPALLDGYRRLLASDLTATDPAAKDTFFAVSGESARRPEVARHRERLDRVPVPERLLLVDRAAGGVPAAVADAGRAGSDTGATADRWPVVPPFGPVPPGLEHTYPANAELPDRADHAAQVAAARAVARLADRVPGPVTLVHADWPIAALDRLPDDVDCRASTDGRGTAATDGPAVDPAADGVDP